MAKYEIKINLETYNFFIANENIRTKQFMKNFEIGDIIVFSAYEDNSYLIGKNCVFEVINVCKPEIDIKRIQQEFI